MDILSRLPTWSPSTIPTSTTLKSIPASFSEGAMETLLSANSAYSTIKGDNIVKLARSARGALATLTIISNQEVLATATDEAVAASATSAIFDATLNLEALYDDLNFFHYYLNRFGNIFYFAVFTLLFFFFAGMIVKSRYWWFNVTFACGYVLEWMGFLGRILAFIDNRSENYFLLSYITLTIAPAFIMAGIYFLFAQLVIVHGTQYSILKPMWYSYLFITIDVLSLAIQAGGGGAASSATTRNTDPKPGTDTMIAGIVIQVFGMTIFMLFWAEFLYRIYFAKTTQKTDRLEKFNNPQYNKLAKRSFGNYMKFLFNTKSVRTYRSEVLDTSYNQQFRFLREGKLFNYFPLAMSIAVIAVYIRSVYRVVELAQGFSGYLYTHEVYLFVLDAMMIAICGLIFVPFHPVFIYGQKVVLRLAAIKKGKVIVDEESGDVIGIEKSNDESTQADTQNIDSRSERFVGEKILGIDEEKVEDSNFASASAETASDNVQYLNTNQVQQVQQTNIERLNDERPASNAYSEIPSPNLNNEPFQYKEDGIDGVNR